MSITKRTFENRGLKSHKFEWYDATMSHEQEPKTNKEQKPKPLFKLGQLVATPGALDAINEAEEESISFLERHVTGDWGNIPEEDKEENALSLEHGFRILSAYQLETGTKIWIITESDRSVTTILLPEEY